VRPNILFEGPFVLRHKVDRYGRMALLAFLQKNPQWNRPPTTSLLKSEPAYFLEHKAANIDTTMEEILNGSLDTD
jgi:hypothetical protein